MNTIMFGGTSDAVIGISARGIVEYWSKGAERTFGYTSGESLGRNLSELIVPGARGNEIHLVLKDCMASGGHVHGFMFRHKDGSLVYADLLFKGAASSGGDIALLVTTKKDALHQRFISEAQVLEKRFGDVIESLPNAIIVTNRVGRVILANTRAERLFGYHRYALLGKHMEQLLPARHRAAHVEQRGAFFQRPDVRTLSEGLELCGLRADGTEFPIEISLCPLHIDDDIVMMSAIRDIAQLRNEEHKFRDLIETSPDAIVIVNSGGIIVLVNSQTEKLFGYTRQELLGQSTDLLLPLRYRAPHAEHRNRYFAEPLESHVNLGLEVYGQRKDGSEFPIEISLTTVPSRDGLLVSSTIRDITAHKRFEELLQQKNSELIAANQAKDRFMASVSEDLRAPLSSIIGFTGTLKLAGAAQETELNTLQVSAQQLLSMLNDRLTPANAQERRDIEVEFADCRRLIGEVVERLRLQARAEESPQAFDPEAFALRIENYLRPELRATRPARNS